MRHPILYFFSFLALSGCATDVPPAAFSNCEELDTVTVIARTPTRRG